MDPQLRELVLGLFDVGCVKFGEFTLKTGALSPIYFDLRVTVSYPNLMAKISELLLSLSPATDLVCGVPYTALPYATAMSLKKGTPMVLRRKEAKGYGTKKLVEGVWKEGASCLVVEDVVTSGTSVWETVEVLAGVGIKVEHAVVLLDREQGGSQMLADRGVTLHSVLKVSQLLAVLEEEGKVEPEMLQKARDFLASSRPTIATTPPPAKFSQLSFTDRAQKTENAVAKRLLTLCDAKQSNLCVAADVDTCAEVLALAKAVGPHIVCLKTHVDILTDYTPAFAAELVAIASEHNFLIFEDRKFADIGSTVQKQYGAGIYHMVDWAHIINAHVLPGPGIIKGLSEVSKASKTPGACLLLAQMSSAGSLCTGDYTAAAVKMAQDHPDFVIGFISQEAVCQEPGFVHMTPGVNLAQEGDGLGQQYNTPEHVVGVKGTDIIIVGRGVYRAADPAAEAQKYRTAAFTAYQKRLA